MVYNWRDDTRLEGRTLIGIGPNVRKKGGILLFLIALRLHTTNLLSGLMFVAIGVLFIVSEGTSSLEGLYASGGATDLVFSVERWAGSLGEGTLISLVFASLGLLFAGLLIYRLARRRKKKPVERGG